MLSDLILEHNGKATGNRILDAGIQKRETTVTARGKVRGLLDVSNYYILEYAKIR
jgi:hypothetical protein